MVNTAEKILKKKAVYKAEMDKIMPRKQRKRLWKKAALKLDSIMNQYGTLPKGVQMHTSRIFPAAAIYLTAKDVVGEEKAYHIIEDAAIHGCEGIAGKLKKLMKVPGMRSLFVAAWDPMTKKMFGERNGFQNRFYPKKKGEYRMDIISCPYNRYFTELGCPELTKIFCENDERTYGNLPGLIFERKGTLGKGAACCDFYIRKSEISQAGAHCHKVQAEGSTEHIQLNELPYCKPVKKWLIDRYGKEANQIWNETARNYNEYLSEIPDYGGKKNGHARAIYGGLLIFALYPALPDQPPITELQDFVQNMFMGPFTTLGKVFNLNRSFDMWLIDKVFRKTGNRDRKDIKRYPDGFINIDEPYDRKHHAARYSFTQCPNAEFAREHDLLHVLPLLCNSDFFGIHEIHGRLIRCGTCGNSAKCDYLIVGNRDELAAEYETVTDAQGFLISRKRKDDK